MQRPEEVQAGILKILKTGLLSVRRCADQGDAVRCAIEANHLHNLPDLIEQCSPERLKYYLDVEVAQYVRETNNNVPGDIEEAWAALRTWLGSQRSSAG